MESLPRVEFRRGEGGGLCAGAGQGQVTGGRGEREGGIFSIFCSSSCTRILVLTFETEMALTVY